MQQQIMKQPVMKQPIMKQHMMDRHSQEDQEIGTQRLELSAFFDGECETAAARRLARRLTEDDALRSDWRVYALIGDHLRGEAGAGAGIASGVMSRLQDEPVVLAPRPLAGRRSQSLMALAASVAGVAVVGWLAWTDPSMSVAPAEQFAAPVPPPSTFSNPTQIAAGKQVMPASTLAEIDEYLLAHHMQASGVRLGDGTERVRTVSHVVGIVRP